MAAMRRHWMLLMATAALAFFLVMLSSTSLSSHAAVTVLGGQSDTQDEIAWRMRGPLMADDPRLIEYIKHHLLLPPSRLPYNLTIASSRRNVYLSAIFIASIVRQLFSVYFSAIFIASIVRQLFRGKKGFFVEAGALDGEYMSHTLNLELQLGWQGLLVEPDPNNFSRGHFNNFSNKLRSKQRKAWTSAICLSVTPYAEEMLLWRAVEGHGTPSLIQGTGRLFSRYELATESELYNAVLSSSQCVPVSSLLLALNITHVDFFVLDVEQVEEKILFYFPFEKISVDVWAVEHVTGYEDQSFIRFMVSKGYYYFDALCAEVPDFIFVRKESEIFEALQVPMEPTNRSAICHFKKARTRTNYSLAVEDLRDLHHYPQLIYRDVPEVNPVPLVGDYLSWSPETENSNSIRKYIVLQ
ncbi:uncharacterized protein LOC108680959 [Hyalella azteca]|uniref:Uncharacterized protein LOC108680959 n=1 Tax=Hyalella azteca TaxID=294128 RepID=A0A979FKQ2_HYAAZ|nr:uncharacterized protein LOC108680959 [Hyalella azteca]